MWHLSRVSLKTIIPDQLRLWGVVQPWEYQQVHLVLWWALLPSLIALQPMQNRRLSGTSILLIPSSWHSLGLCTNKDPDCSVQMDNHVLQPSETIQMPVFRPMNVSIVNFRINDHYNDWTNFTFYQKHFAKHNCT